MYKRPIIFILIPFILLIIIVEAFFPVFFLNNHYSISSENESQYKLRIIEEMSIKKKTISYKARVTHILKDSIWQETKGKVVVYFNKEDSNAYNLKYGQVIISKTPFRDIENYSASDFDYKRYMKQRRYYQLSFIKPWDWKLTDETSGNIIIAKAKILKKNIEERLIESGLGDKESSLAIALLLGDKTLVDKDLRTAFNSTGLAHILCVSGLHIGIIMLVIDFFLKLITLANYRLFALRKIIVILIGFSICFIVGLTPSSLRVATMISILFLTKHLSRGYDYLNILFLTAFIFLLIDPLILFNWSFQLSFLAILGISVFSKTKHKFNSLFPFYLQPITSIMGMTLSAQFFVLPILIFRFKSLPTYILLGNMLIVPMLSIVLVFILLMLIVGNSGFLSEIITPILNFLLTLMINIVEFINSLPYSSIKL